MLRLKKFDTTFMVIYHLCVLAFAYFTYTRLDFNENFEMPENTRVIY